MNLTEQEKSVVMDSFDKAMTHTFKEASINMWWSGTKPVLDRLIKRYIGKVFVGYEYKGHLFRIVSGHGDCCYNVKDLGEI